MSNSRVVYDVCGTVCGNVFVVLGVVPCVLESGFCNEMVCLFVSGALCIIKTFWVGKTAQKEHAKANGI